MDPLSSGELEVADRLERLADRLRSLSDVRLARDLPPHGSRADAAHAFAQRLADAAARLQGEPARLVPRLHDLAVADQVAVTGHDFVAAVQAVDPAQRPVAQLLVSQMSLACRELAAAL